MALTDVKLRNLLPRPTLYRVADSRGLCIEVTPAGSKLWRYRYRYLGKASMLMLGEYPGVYLADARRARRCPCAAGRWNQPDRSSSLRQARAPALG
ncbi:MAG: Arm DNA-binding domain-containing protein [Rhodanobacteraceae bacterium]